MLKTSVKIGKKIYWLAERSAEDVFFLDQLANSKEIKGNSNGELVASLVLLSHYFRSYYNSIPYWNVIEKIRYKLLSNYRNLKTYFPLSIIQLFLQAGQHLESQVKKKIRDY